MLLLAIPDFVRNLSDVTSVKRSLIQYKCIFDVITAIRHNGYDSVGTSRQLFEVDQLDGLKQTTSVNQSRNLKTFQP